jgi:hypothetical protein
VHRGFIHLLLQGFMTIPAEFLFILYQQEFIRSGMCMMAVRAYTLLEGSMHVSLGEKILDTFMATQTKGIHVFFYQIFEITCVYIMTGFTLSLFEREMDITLGKFLLKLCMALITNLRDFTLDTCLSISKIAISQNKQQRAER